MNDPMIQPPMPYMDEFMPSNMGGNPQGDRDIRWQLSSDDVIERLKLTLLNKGVKFDEKTGKTEIYEKGHPLMNEEGVEEIATLFLETMFQRGIILSNFTDKNIYKIMRILRTKLVLLLRRKWKDYEINKANLSSIVEVIDNVIYATFMRAAYEGERKYLTTTQRISESTMRQDQPKEKKPFSLFGNRRD